MSWSILLDVQRPQTHVLGATAELFVELHLAREWIVRRATPDYGVDLSVEIVRDSEVSGEFFSVQVKAVATAPATDVRVRIETAALSYLRGRVEPVMLVVYVASEQEAYWTWVRDIPVVESQTATVYIPRTNRLTATDWRAIGDAIHAFYAVHRRVTSAADDELKRIGQYSVAVPRSDILTAADVDLLERLVESPTTREVDLQHFIEHHPRAFLGGEYLRMHAQVRLRGNDERILIPDFIIEHVSGLCDILELKMPGANVTAGAKTRRRYSFTAMTAAAQTREYRDFFDDSVHREWFEATYNLKAYAPRTILLIGRDADFADPVEKRRLEVDLGSYHILTYDDLLRIARANAV